MNAFLFRCDVSPAIGLGHLRRCAVLAAELRRRGARTAFACRAEDADPAPELEGAADEIVPVEQSIGPEEDARLVARLARERGAAAVVADRFGADGGFGAALAAERLRWLQFDWAAREPIWADWILNANPDANERTYRRLLKKAGARLLLGPSYALLPPRFGELARQRRDSGAGRILVTLGGGDDRGGTELCLDALGLLDQRPACTLLVGPFNPRRRRIEEKAAGCGGNVTVVFGERDAAARMAEADIAVIGGGTTTFEAAAMGLPFVVIQIAENQSRNAKAWDRAGAGLDAGPVERLAPGRLARLLSRLLEDGARRASLSSAGMARVDCRGAARVAEALTEGGRHAT